MVAHITCLLSEIIFELLIGHCLTLESYSFCRNLHHFNEHRYVGIVYLLLNKNPLNVICKI